MAAQPLLASWWQRGSMAGARRHAADAFPGAGLEVRIRFPPAEIWKKRARARANKFSPLGIEIHWWHYPINSGSRRNTATRPNLSGRGKEWVKGPSPRHQATARKRRLRSFAISRDAGASSNALAAAPRQLTIMADTRIAAETSFSHHLFI